MHKYIIKIIFFWSKFKGRPLLYFAVFFFVCFLLYCLIWYSIGSYLKSYVNSNIDRANANNIVLGYDSANLIGFPHDLSIIVREPFFANSSKTFGWSTDNIVITPLVFADNSLRIDFPKDNNFSIYRESTKTIDKISVRSRGLRVSSSFNNNLPKRINLSANDLILQFFDVANSFKVGSVSSVIYEDKLLIDDLLDDMITAEINIVDLQLSPFWKSILESDIKQVNALFHIRNPNKINDIDKINYYALRGFNQPELIINKVKLFHHLSDLTFKGALYLDEDMTFNGNINANISNYRKLLSFLQNKKVISEDFAQQLRGLFSFMKLVDGVKDFEKGVNLNLSVRKNIIYHNKLPLLQIPIVF